MSEIKPIQNDHPGAWHREKFAAFAAAKAAIGEPTPHMRVVDWMCRDSDDAERVWRTGAYLAGYSVITGEAIWTAWSWPRVRDAVVTRGRDQEMAAWLREHWAGIHTRKPRRCVRTPGKFARCVNSFARWAEVGLPRLLATRYATPQEEYDAWWRSANTIEFYGRYVSIRLLECMRRYGYMSAHLYDIRAVGAHSPIRCLMLLRPERVDDLMAGRPEVVDAIAREVKGELEVETGVEMSFFTYATILCEYRAGYEDGGDYAGNQHDEELEYSLSRYAKYWSDQGRTSALYTARAAIDPHECLGEVQGWSTRRRDVAALMRTEGVVWSDLVHDYAKFRAGEPYERAAQ